MKRFFLFQIMLFLSIVSFSQFKISGKILTQDNYPIQGAVVTINNGYAISNNLGYFELSGLKTGNYTIKVEQIDYLSKFFNFYLENDTVIDVKLETDNINELEEVIVQSVRASKHTPMAYSSLTQAEIEKRNTTQDVPYLLLGTPSLTTSSDGGTGVGYTQMKIRGTDISGINVTLNGIPLNDAESQGVWWVDVPDFAASVDNIQIQRGVGSSTNGAGAFGASINLKTNRISRKPVLTSSNSFGSFNTLRNTITIGSGTINNHFAVEGRLSKIHSDGFIDRARVDMKSYYLSGAYFDEKTLIKLNVFSGIEDTYQAWNGVPKARLNSDEEAMKLYLDHGNYSEEQYQQMLQSDPRKYNLYTYKNEIDYYVQSHYQLHAVRKITNNLTFETSAFLVKGKGYYEQFKNKTKYKKYGLKPVIVGADTINKTDLVRRKWLDNEFYGLNYNFVYQKDRLNIVLGGSWSNYKGYHYGEVIWFEYAGEYDKDYEWYRNLGEKSDLNNFLKVNYDFFDKLNLYADVQYRVINYTLSGINDDLEKLDQTHKFNFLNPKFGLLYHPNLKNNAYFSFAVAHKEPTRTDFVDAPSKKMPTEQTLYDFELGYKLSLSKFSLNVNLYYMDYDNQLIKTGEINDVGSAIATNVKDSYRRGIEVVWGTKFNNFLEWNANFALSQNKIQNFSEHVDNWDYWSDPENNQLQIVNKLGETDIAFSPAFSANNSLTFYFLKFFSFDINSQYVGRQFIDNTSNTDNSLDPYLVNNIALHADFETKFVKNINITFRVNNIFNEKYETLAWVYSYYLNNEKYAIDGYFPQAGTNFLLSLNLKF